MGQTKAVLTRRLCRFRGTAQAAISKTEAKTNLCRTMSRARSLTSIPSARDFGSSLSERFVQHERNADAGLAQLLRHVRSDSRHIVVRQAEGAARKQIASMGLRKASRARASSVEPRYPKSRPSARRPPPRKVGLDGTRSCQCRWALLRQGGPGQSGHNSRREESARYRLQR
jgi:hypothetical protein